MPPPKHNPRRRNARVGPMVLPAAGRRGRAPRWPLPDQSTDEAKLWAELWHTPQSVAWEGLGWTRTVARYARTLVRAEDAEAKADVLAEARQLEDRLGLTPKAMRLLLWTVEEQGETRSTAVVVVPDRWRDTAVG
jgi:hypothetical protein